MNLPRREILRLAAGAATLAAAPRLARAQAYPTRPVRILVGFAPGGGTDIMARLLGAWLGERLGQNFLVENRTGAGTNIATEMAIRAAPDGYTLLEGCLPNAANGALYPGLSFDFVRDVTPVAGASRESFIIEVHPDVPVHSVPELIAYAKANPGKLTMASAGIGSGNQLFGELFQSMTGTKFVDVTYRGAGPALVDLMAGRAQIMFASISSSIGFLKAGKLRGLAVTMTTRQPALPDLPTVAEFVPGYDTSFWQGLVAPKGTPANVVDTLNRAVNAALADPKIKARFDELGVIAMPGTPADFGKLIAAETARWSKVIRTAGIKAE
ncbi:MAG TPA: tripartite tricarboxylate transporter substrate binding protein [Xanthobacteraceae bacterium]|nr:tripartite tricarboxylate transporter substrate binding protein [Xanthobacteraceae bacterium]